MTQESPKNNNVLIVIAIISVVGTIVASIVGAIGNYNTEKMRQEAELTRIALVATPKLITVILTNPACTSINYYVDGKLMVSSLQPKAKMPFDITPGKHQVYVCFSDNTGCGDVIQVDWKESTTATIIDASSTCPITISLTNPACTSINYYVDGKLMVSSLEAKSTVNFEITPGKHQVYVCFSDNTGCGDAVQVDWTESTTATIIDTSSTCP